MNPDTQGSTTVQEDVARRRRERDVFALPAARWPFRIVGGAIAAACALVLWLRVAAVWRGETALLDLLQTEYAMLIFALTFGLTLGVLAFTGKVPRLIWNLFRRGLNSVD